MYRLENTPLLIANWLQHQRRDASGSTARSARTTPTSNARSMRWAAWADGYSNAVPRLLASLKAPAKGLIGPWAHKYPHFAKPGPAIGFLQDTLRWWDQWLKGKDTGIMDEPQIPGLDGGPGDARRLSAASARPLGRRAVLALQNIRASRWRSIPDGSAMRPGRDGADHLLPQDTGLYAGPGAPTGWGPTCLRSAEEDGIICFDGRC